MSSSPNFVSSLRKDCCWEVDACPTSCGARGDAAHQRRSLDVASVFADELRTIDDYGRLSTRLRAAMGPHIVDILRQGLLIVLDFQANTVSTRNWMRSLIGQSGAAHELHLLDVPDTICKQRLRQRNAAGEHLLQVSEAEYDLFTSYLAPPGPSEGFNLVVHTP